MGVELVLTVAQAQELASLLEVSQRDMSSEIADTDNPEYRAQLKTRRRLLVEVSDMLKGLLAGPEQQDQLLGGKPEELMRELAHPGG